MELKEQVYQLLMAWEAEETPHHQAHGYRLGRMQSAAELRALLEGLPVQVYEAEIAEAMARNSVPAPAPFRGTDPRHRRHRG
jgi:hypothetical protein